MARLGPPDTPPSRRLGYLLFPAELVVGLTVAVVWYYLRNVLGRLVPGSFSLRELGMLPWLVATSQLAAIGLARVRRAPTETITSEHRAVVASLPLHGVHAHSGRNAWGGGGR